MPPEVTWEAEIAYKTTLQRFHELTKFRLLQQAIANFGPSEAREYIEKISIMDADCINTHEEIANSLRICNSELIDALIGVSNASHAPRCVALANKEILQKGYRKLFYITSPCDTDFSEGEDPLVFEPQSGPGSPHKLSSCVVLQGYFDLAYEKKMDFLENAKSLLGKGDD